MPEPGEEVDEDMKRHPYLAAAAMAFRGRPVLDELLELPARPGLSTPLPQGSAAPRERAAQELAREARALRVR